MKNDSGKLIRSVRSNRQANYIIFIIKNVIQRNVEEGKEVLMTFVNLRKTFDTVD